MELIGFVVCSIAHRPRCTNTGPEIKSAQDSLPDTGLADLRVRRRA